MMHDFEKNIVGYLKIYIFAVRKRTRFLGRVARQRSAKPCTAVRLRQEPQPKAGFYPAFFVCGNKKSSLLRLLLLLLLLIFTISRVRGIDNASF